MTKTTRVFDRLPSDAGVTFEGFQDIRIKSREIVKEKLEEFVEYCKIAKKPAIRVILGEWGEGKTDAYQRYLLPKSEGEGNYAFFISASTLLNSFDMPDVKKLMESTPLSALRFLVALFSGIREECKESSIPRPKNYKDAESYMEETFTNLIGRNKAKRIFVFIDEFEELLLYQARLREIISGIKETINGRFAPIDERGKYAGCLHLIVAATPDAYYRLQVSEDTALIFGGLGRRGGTIELPLIRKYEGIEFLYALLRYSYTNNLPPVLPFETIGIFHNLVKITQGNPGNMVSLFTRLMSSAKYDKKNIVIVNSEHFLDFLGKEQVFVYGGTTPCLETETFYRIVKIVEEQRLREVGQKCTLLFKTITGELKPFPLQELEKKIGYQEVRNLISIINNELKTRMGIERAIIKVASLREDKSFEDVKEAFKEYITMEKDKRWIKIENYSESLEDFEDRVTFFDLENNKILARIFLPSERNSVASFFEGISQDKATELENMILRRLCTRDEYYLASDELLSQIFPTPIPRELEFIKNRELRMKLWREVTRNLAEQYTRYMPTAFNDLLENFGKFKIEDIKPYAPKAMMRFVKLGIDDLNINSLFYAASGDVKSEDVEEISKWIKGIKPPTHCVVLLYTGEITEQAQNKIEDKELGKERENVLLNIHLHPTLSKRIISIYRARFQFSEQINAELYLSVVRKIVAQDIDFETKIENWLEMQEDRGAVIRKLEIESTPNIREFANALKFYINFMEKEGTAQEIFERNEQELLRFVRYESKVGLIPDIELPAFTRISEELKKYGFLQLVKEKYHLQAHPIETKLLKVLNREKKLSEAEIQEYFVTKSAKFLKEIFIPILEYKGKIKREGNYYSINEPTLLSREVESEFQRFERLINSKKEYWDYGYIYMTKERGERFISLKNFHEYVNNLLQAARSYYGLKEDIVLQKFSLLQKLLANFTEEFIPLFDAVIDEVNKLMINTSTQFSTFKNSLTELETQCDKWIKLKFKVDNINEFREVAQIYEKILEYAKYTHDDVLNVLKSFGTKERKVFYFRNADGEAFHFNLKLYKMSEQNKKLNETIENHQRVANEINDIFRSFNEERDRIVHAVKTRIIDKKFSISNAILESLRGLLKEILPHVEPIVSKTITLRQINDAVERNKRFILSNLQNLNSCLTFLDDVLEKDKNFKSSLSHMQDLSTHILWIFDIPRYKEQAANFAGRVKKFIDEYENSLKSMDRKDSESLLRTTKNIRGTLETLARGIEKEVYLVNDIWERFTKESVDFIESLERIMQIVDKKHQISTKDIYNKLVNFKEKTMVESIEKLSLRLSEIEKIKEDIRESFYKVIAPVLHENDVNVLQVIMETTKVERKTWLDTAEFRAIARRELKLKSDELDKIVQKLIREGFLKPGISLTF